MKTRLLPLALVPLLALSGCAKSIDEIHEIETQRYGAALESMRDEGVTLGLDNALAVCDKHREGMDAGEIVEDMQPVDPVGMLTATEVVLAEMCES